MRRRLSLALLVGALALTGADCNGGGAGDETPTEDAPVETPDRGRDGDDDDNNRDDTDDTDDDSDDDDDDTDDDDDDTNDDDDDDDR